MPKKTRLTLRLTGQKRKRRRVMADLMDKIKNLRSRVGNGTRTSTKGIFLSFEDGPNVLRLVGDFLEVKTHFISPVKGRKDRGLCVPDAFRGDDNLPPVVNCPDWNIDTESENAVKTYPFCKLNRMVRETLYGDSASEIADEDKKFLDLLQSQTRARTCLKWNVIDRKDPYVVEETPNGEKKVLGYKIATIGMEAWSDVEEIFNQLGFDITDEVKGVDINIIKGNNGARVAYQAQVVLAGMTVANTPLTEEEKALTPHDLKKICGKVIEPDKLVAAMHEDLQQMLDVDVKKK